MSMKSAQLQGRTNVARRLVDAAVVFALVLSLGLIGACDGDDDGGGVDADMGMGEDASSGGDEDASSGGDEDASAGTDASSDTADASGGDLDGDTSAQCESRTFDCGEGTCDALTEYCHIEDGEATCEALATPEECSTCSTQVSVLACSGQPGQLESDNEYPPGCTLNCD